MTNILIFKLIAVVLIVLAAKLGGYFAFKIKSSERSVLLFSLGNTFAAGIFLGAGLIHMLPDATEGFNEIVNSDFPYASFIAALGFLLILFIEKTFVRHEAFNSSESDKKLSSYPYILITILSIHSIIAGVALGTEDRITQSIIIFIAILAHKGSAAFALSISMIKSEMQKHKISKLITLFSFMTPIGILIGAIIANILSGDASEFVIAVFDALAAGTFIYVSIMDIFNEEFKTKENSYMKFIMAILGLLLMALLAVWL